MPSDWDLLYKFAREKDQGGGGGAFKELVAQHIDMVHGVARRQLGTSASHADDAVQAVFLLLSQRVDRITPKGSLAGWLFRATRYCCANIKKSEDRRQRHERESAMEPKEDTETNEELTAVLDEALGQLSEKERQTILVRYMERKSVAETSKIFGVSVNAVEKRLQYGIEKIRRVFARKGFVVPAAAVGAVMMAESAKAAPAGLAASTVGVTTQASASVVGIAKGALTMMQMAIAKTIAVAAMVAAIVTIAVTVPLLSKIHGEPEIVTEVKGKTVETQANYPEAFTLPDKSTAIPLEVKHNCPATVPFANEFSYFLDYSGQGYGFINGGDGHGWRSDVNYTLADILTGHAMRPACLRPTRDELHHPYRVAGFSPRTYYADPAKGEYKSEAQMKDVIKHALCTLGQPVILPVKSRYFGSVVVGYKENGKVLVTFGYPPYHEAPDNTKPQLMEVADWYNDKTELTIVGLRQSTPDVKEMYQEAFRQILAYFRAGIHGKDQHYYEEWESFLRLSIDDMMAEVKRTRRVPGSAMVGGELPPGEITDQQIRKAIHLIADPTWCEMAERRYYLWHFFRQAVQHFPDETGALLALANHFLKSCEIMGDKGYISEVGHSPANEINDEAFEKPEVRVRMAEHVSRFREADAQGLAMIETLLTRMKITTEKANMIPNRPSLVIADGWKGENYHFNGAARYVMGCLGETNLADYFLFAGVTGDSFTQVYSLSGVKGACASDFYLGLRGLVSVFEKVGYAAESFSQRELQADRKRFLKKITDSIDKGVPVIWLRPRDGAIVGYEANGNVLLYLSLDKTEPERLVLDEVFLQAEQHKNLMDRCGWIVVGQKKHDVSLKQIYRDAILQLPKLLTLKTDEYVFGAEAFRAWANDIENGKFDKIKPEEFNGNFFAYEIYVVNLATNSGGCRTFLEKAQELNPDFTFLEDVRKQYRITNYLWNKGYWNKDVHSPAEREEMVRFYGNDSLETLGGAFGCKLETLQDKQKRAPIVEQLREFASSMDEVVRILKENLPSN